MRSVFVNLLHFAVDFDRGIFHRHPSIAAVAFGTDVSDAGEGHMCASYPDFTCGGRFGETRAAGRAGGTVGADVRRHLHQHRLYSQQKTDCRERAARA